MCADDTTRGALPRVATALQRIAAGAPSENARSIEDPTARAPNSARAVRWMTAIPASRLLCTVGEVRGPLRAATRCARMKHRPTARGEAAVPAARRGWVAALPSAKIGRIRGCLDGSISDRDLFVCDAGIESPNDREDQDDRTDGGQPDGPMSPWRRAQHWMPIRYKAIPDARCATETA